MSKCLKRKNPARQLKSGVNLRKPKKKTQTNRRHNWTRFDQVMVSGVSQNALKEPEDPVWSKLQQGVITPLPMYAQSDVGSTVRLRFRKSI